MDKKFIAGAESALREIYEEYNVSEDFIRQFTEEICDYLDDDYGLNAILSLTYSFEEEARAEGINIEVGCQCLVYDSIVNLLDVNAENAHMLYESFTEYHDICAFDRLMTDFKEYLSEEEVKKVMAIARETFIPFCWEIYDEE